MKKKRHCSTHARTRVIYITALPGARTHWRTRRYLYVAPARAGPEGPTLTSRRFGTELRACEAAPSPGAGCAHRFLVLMLSVNETMCYRHCNAQMKSFSHSLPPPRLFLLSSRRFSPRTWAGVGEVCALVLGRKKNLFFPPLRLSPESLPTLRDFYGVLAQSHNIPTRTHVVHDSHTRIPLTYID